MENNNAFATGAESSSSGFGYEQGHVDDHGGYYILSHSQIEDQQVTYVLTRNGLRNEAAINTTLVQKIIQDFCNSSERLEHIGAMEPTPSGLQYWVRDSKTGEAMIVAECVYLLTFAPQYIMRVPQNVRLAFEALNTPKRQSNATLPSLWICLQYIEEQQATQTPRAQNQVPWVDGSRLQPPVSTPVFVQPRFPHSESIIQLRRSRNYNLQQGERTEGVRPIGISGTYQYEWPVSRKLAWHAITPCLEHLPGRALASSYCMFNSVALWEHVDVRKIGPNIRVTLVEIAAFFPKAATMWRALWRRFEAGGWTLHQLRELIFYLRDLQVADLRAHSFGSMKKHRTAALGCAPAGLTLNNIETNRVGSRIEFGDLRDCFLVSLGDGLVHWPQGEDAGILTVAVRHARWHGHDNVRLSDLERYVVQERAHIQYPLPASSHLSAAEIDKQARERIFPQETYDSSRGHQLDYDYVSKWWVVGGYYHGD